MSTDFLLSRANQDPARYNNFWQFLDRTRRGEDLVTAPSGDADLQPVRSLARALMPALYPRNAGISAVGSDDYRTLIRQSGLAGVGRMLTAGAGRGDASFLLRGELPAPGNLLDFGADSAPTTAEVSNAPQLLGEQGGQPGTFADPRRTFDRARVQSATSPASVAPPSVGLSQPQRDPAGAAVSTTHAPDYGVEAAAVERSRQLPSRDAHRQLVDTEEAQANAVQKTTTVAGSMPPPNPKRRRGNNDVLPPGSSNAQATLSRQATT